MMGESPALEDCNLSMVRVIDCYREHGTLMGYELSYQSHRVCRKNVLFHLSFISVHILQRKSTSRANLSLKALLPCLQPSPTMSLTAAPGGLLETVVGESHNGPSLLCVFANGELWDRIYMRRGVYQYALYSGAFSSNHIVKVPHSLSKKRTFHSSFLHSLADMNCILLKTQHC